MPSLKTLVLSISLMSTFIACGIKLKSLPKNNETNHSSTMTPSQISARINQIGYHPFAKKIAILSGETLQEIILKDKMFTEVFRGPVSSKKMWTPSMETVIQFDFSNFQSQGEYALFLDTNRISPWFDIMENPYHDAAQSSLKWFYFQRASSALPEKYAGIYHRPAGHLDEQVKFHPELGKTGSFKSPKGWYDAGDYGKYITNSGISTYTLLNLYESHPAIMGNWRWNIPPEGALPDILAEAKWNLDWMLTMQDRDGGVFHKLSTLKFPGDIMPDRDNSDRYVIGKSVTATLNFSALCAYASRLYRPFDENYANELRGAALRAYDWAQENPTAFFKQPSDVQSGSYKDDHAEDEFLWAASELYLLKKDSSYLQFILDQDFSGETPGWPQVDGLAIYSILNHKDTIDSQLLAKARTSLLSSANKLLGIANYEAYPIAMTEKEFVWGSNNVAANQGILLWYAFKETKDPKYLKAAQNTLDYLLGMNPLEISYLTGFGTKTPLNPHHRPSTADGIEAPIPGMLVGGPHKGGQDIGNQTWQCEEYRLEAANSYIDEHCSYATNEVAINWNAPFALLATLINHSYASKTPLP